MFVFCFYKRNNCGFIFFFEILIHICIEKSPSYSFFLRVIIFLYDNSPFYGDESSKRINYENIYLIIIIIISSCTSN